MQRQHRRKLSVIVGDEQAPALLDLERNPRAQLRQQEIAGLLDPRRDPAVHPDPRDRVIFVRQSGADGVRRHRMYFRKRAIPYSSFRGARATREPGIPRRYSSAYHLEIPDRSAPRTVRNDVETERAPAILSRGLLRLQSDAAVIPRLAVAAGPDRSDRHSSPWSTPPRNR